jgi:diguanylate cyclase (GGDEF)-like protein
VVPTEVLVVLSGLALVALGALLAWLRERRRWRRSRTVALRDPLTGLASRIALEHQLAIDWERFERYGRPLGVVVVDLDELKRVNDTEGHAAGDELIRRAGRLIGGAVRRSDLPCRLAGDEFVVITVETSAVQLESLAARLRETAEAEGLKLSIGWAQADGDADAAALLDRADKAMYRDKRARKTGRSASPGHERRRPSPGGSEALAGA